jgi:hypothetical protein
MPQAHNLGNDSSVAGATVKDALNALNPIVPVTYCYGRFQPQGAGAVINVIGTHSFTAVRSSIGQFSCTWTIPSGYAILGFDVFGNDGTSSDRRYFESGVGLSGGGGVTFNSTLWSYQRTANSPIDVVANANSFIWVEGRITPTYPSA